MKKILFLVVHHSGKDKTLKLFRSLVDQEPGGEIDLCVVDNSVNESEHLALADFRTGRADMTVSIIVCENKGYFRSANEGLLNKNKSIYSHIVICNNDLRFDRFFVTKLIERCYPDHVHVIYPALFDNMGINQNPRVINRVSVGRLIAYKIYYSNYILSRALAFMWSILARILSRFKKGGEPEEKLSPYQILLGVGACIVLTPKFFAYYDFLPEEVFLFGEEALLAAKVDDVGGKIVYDSILRVWHDEHSTVGKMRVRRYWEIQKESSRHYLPALWKLRRK